MQLGTCGVDPDPGSSVSIQVDPNQWGNFIDPNNQQQLCFLKICALKNVSFSKCRNYNIHETSASVDRNVCFERKRNKKGKEHCVKVEVIRKMWIRDYWALGALLIQSPGRNQSFRSRSHPVRYEINGFPPSRRLFDQSKRQMFFFLSVLRSWCV